MQFELRPMLATLTDKPFDDPGWVFETKWDGFRAIAVAKPGQAALYSRNLNDISRKYPSICAALAKIKHEAVLDGELVALDEHGRSRFQLLQNAEREFARLLYCVFDLLYLDDKDLRGKTLLERKGALEKILPKSPLLLYSAHVVGEGIEAFNRAKRAHEEGVMAKLSISLYHSGMRTRDWLKVKASQEQEVVIVGFTAPRGSRKYFGALVLAVREGTGWRYVGRAGTGFDTKTPRYLRPHRPGIQSLAQGCDGAAQHSRSSSCLFDLAGGAARAARPHRPGECRPSRRATADAAARAIL
jgi:bifunctional non-homologous end joining protein LigD